MSASGSRRYIVTDRMTGEIVKNCFVLRPDIDDPAFEALRAYIRWTPDKALAEQIDAWLCRIADEKYRRRHDDGTTDLAQRRILDAGATC